VRIKNLYELPLEKAAIHDGVGLCDHASVFQEADFKTPIRFINYTVLPPHTSFGLHRHGDDNEVYLVLEGEGEYTANGETQRVKKGSLMVNEPFATHGLINTGDSEMKMLVFEVYNPNDRSL
jgi:quercetin dioxygenase-like cupin family protein